MAGGLAAACGAMAGPANAAASTDEDKRKAAAAAVPVIELPSRLHEVMVLVGLQLPS